MMQHAHRPGASSRPAVEDNHHVTPFLNKSNANYT
jgi:hypothetical protein